MQKSARTLLLLLVPTFIVAGCVAGTGPDPLPPGTISTITDFSAGDYHFAVVTLDGALRTCGSNEYGQLGDLYDSFYNNAQDTPIVIDAIDVHTDWVDVSAGGFHTLAIAQKDSDLTLWGWGLNLSGQAGHWWTDDPVTTPNQIGADTDWESVSAGYYHSAAIKEDGTLWTWGMNWYGELGTSGGSRASPVQVVDDDGDDTNDDVWASVSAGSYYTLAIRKDGSLWAWGANYWGQLGIGTNDGSAHDAPELVGSGWRTVSAGYCHSAGIKTDGTLWAWGGYGLRAHLGDGTYVGKRSPVQIGTDTDWDMVSVGNDHTLATKDDGSLWTWGDPVSGKLGNGSFVNEEDEPVEIQPGTTWSRVSAGGEYSLGLRAGGPLKAWGDNGYGQLGIGSHDDMAEPESVSFPP